MTMRIFFSFKKFFLQDLHIQMTPLSKKGQGRVPAMFLLVKSVHLVAIGNTPR